MGTILNRMTGNTGRKASVKAATLASAEARKSLRGEFGKDVIEAIQLSHDAMRTAAINQDYLSAAGHIASTMSVATLYDVIRDISERRGKAKAWDAPTYGSFVCQALSMVHDKQWANDVVSRRDTFKVGRQKDGTSAKSFIQRTIDAATPFEWALALPGDVPTLTKLQQWLEH